MTRKMSNAFYPARPETADTNSADARDADAVSAFFGDIRSKSFSSAAETVDSECSELGLPRTHCRGRPEF